MRAMEIGKNVFTKVKNVVKNLEEKVGNIFNSIINKKHKDKVTSSSNSIKGKFKSAVKNNDKSRNHSTKFSLKRGFVTAGVALAIGVVSFFSLKNVPKFHQSMGSKITMESNDDAFNGLTSYINTLSNESKMVTEQQPGIEKQITSIKTMDDKENTIKFGDDIRLNDGVELNYTSMGDGPSTKIDKLACDSYNINRIAVLSKNGEEVIYNKEITNSDKLVNIEKFTDKCRSKFGKDVQFAVNVDGTAKNGDIYEDAGWTSLDNLNMSTDKEYLKTLRSKK